MTTWVERPREGRPRGPVGLARSWVEVIVRPRRFFRAGVAPGDQAPGLVFGVVVALAFVGGLFAFEPGSIPSFAGSRPASAVLSLLAVALFVAPATLHLAAALQTLALVALVRERAGVSETVQVLAYATAPCVLAGLPLPGLRAACGLYGFCLLVVGLATVHGTSLTRATLAALVPGSLVFGYGFRAFGAAVALATEWTLV